MAIVVVQTGYAYFALKYGLLVNVIFHIRVLTRLSIYGAMTPPALAQKELIPSPTLRTTVGKSSAVQIYITENAAAAPAFPIKAKTTVTH